MGDNVCNSRLNKCVYWIHQATLHGFDVDAVISRALAGHNDVSKHRATTKCSLLKNFRRMVRFGCVTPENLLQLKMGYSATITTGRYKGQKMEVDHVVPKALMPSLAKDFANLCFQPHRINRSKSDFVARAQLRAVKVFARNGLVPLSTVQRMIALVDGELSARAARIVMPGTSAHLESAPSFARFGLGATDPRVILARVWQLIDRISDWEPRADSALDVAENVQCQTAEHLARSQALLNQVESRGQEDATAVRRLETELANWQSRGESELIRAGKCVDLANATSNRVRQSRQHWKREVSFAEAWTRKAIYLENKASNEVERAEEALDRARTALTHAEDQLSRARERTRVVGRDSDGKPIREPIDTTPYEKKVEAAQERVARCEERLERANDELRRAIAEREAAEARVYACTRAVRLTSDAEISAMNAVHAAQIAMAAVDRASEEHVRASTLTDQARKALCDEEASANSMAHHNADATAFEADAVTYLKTAVDHHASSRQKSSLGCMEISWRMEHLHSFDRPIIKL